MAVTKLAKTIVVKNVHLVVIVIAKDSVVDHVLDVQEPVKKVQQVVICVWIALVLVMLHVQKPAQALVTLRLKDVQTVQEIVRGCVLETVQAVARDLQQKKVAVLIVAYHVKIHVQQYAWEIVQVHVAQDVKRAVLVHVLAPAQALVIQLV